MMIIHVIKYREKIKKIVELNYHRNVAEIANRTRPNVEQKSLKVVACRAHNEQS